MNAVYMLPEIYPHHFQEHILCIDCIGIAGANLYRHG